MVRLRHRSSARSRPSTRRATLIWNVETDTTEADLIVADADPDPRQTGLAGTGDPDSRIRVRTSWSTSPSSTPSCRPGSGAMPEHGSNTALVVRGRRRRPWCIAAAGVPSSIRMNKQQQAGRARRRSRTSSTRSPTSASQASSRSPNFEPAYDGRHRRRCVRGGRSRLRAVHRPRVLRGGRAHRDATDVTTTPR